MPTELGYTSSSGIYSMYLPVEIRDQQRICRDCYLGATIIKSKNLVDVYGRKNSSKYLPAINVEGEDENWKSQYLDEAWFVPAYEEFIDDCVGLMNFNSSDLKIGVAEEELYWLTRFTCKDKTGISGLKIRINTEQWIVGQYILALDVFIDIEGKPQFTVIEYKSEDLILHAEINGYEHIVLRETKQEFDPLKKVFKEVAYARIFGLETGSDKKPQYFTATISEKEWMQTDISNLDPSIKIYPEYKQRRLNRLPVVVINTTSLGVDEFTKVPAYALADSVVQLYRRDGRQTFGHRFAANPTPVFTNVKFPDLVKQERKGEDYCIDKDPDMPSTSGLITMRPQTITIGGSKAIVMESSHPQFPATVDFLEPVCAGFASMEESIKRMLEYIKGWDIRALLSTTGTNASAEAVSMRGQVGIGDIQLVDEICGDGISMILRIAAMWTGVSEKDAFEKIEFDVNKDYVRTEYVNANSSRAAEMRSDDASYQPQEGSTKSGKAPTINGSK